MRYGSCVKPVMYVMATSVSVSPMSFVLWPNLPSKDQTDWQDLLLLQCAAALTVAAARDHE